MTTITKTGREYRGWTISYDPPPIPWRGADWTATHPNYDASYEDGSWHGNGKSVEAASLDELIREIDAWIEENGDDA
jgi:hypothetical protein